MGRMQAEAIGNRVCVCVIKFCFNASSIYVRVKINNKKKNVNAGC